MTRSARWFDGTVDACIAVTFLVELGVVFVNVFARAAGMPLLWIDEVTGIALAILTFVGGAAAYGRGRFLSLRVVVQRFSPRVQHTIAAFFEWLALATSLVIALASFPLFAVYSTQFTAFLGISKGYTIVPIIAGMIVMSVYAVRRLRAYDARTIAGSGVILCAAGGLAVLTQGWWMPAFTGPLAVAVTLAVFGAGVLLGLPVAFALAVANIAFVYGAHPTTMSALPTQMLGGVSSFLLLALPFFVFAGFVMERGGISLRLVQFVCAIVGHIRGGLLQAMVLAMYLVSGMSGSKSGDIAAVGTAMNQMLRRERYSPAESVGVLCASAVMGETIPPSIAMLVLGTITTVSVSALFVAGVVPAAVIGAALLLTVYVRARRQGRIPVSRFEWRRVASSGLGAIPALLMLVILFGGILSGFGTPTEVSSFAVVYALVLALALYRGLTVAGTVRALTEAAMMSGMILFIIANAKAFSWVLTISELPQAIAAWLQGAHLGVPIFIFLSIVLLVVMGALLEGIAALLVLGPLLVPIAATVGTNTLHYAILLIVAMGVGAFSPPLGVGFYVACAVGDAPVEEAMRIVPQFLGVVFAGLLVIAFFPWITLALPRVFGMTQ